MITAEQIRNRSLKRSFFGFRTADVEALLAQVQAQLQEDADSAAAQETREQQLTQDNLQLRAQTAELESNYHAAKSEVQSLQTQLDEVRAELERYRAESDELKATLLKANRMSEAILREAHDDADAIQTDAQAKAEEMVRQATELRSRVNEETQNSRGRLETFRAAVLELIRGEMDYFSQVPACLTALDEAEKKAPIVDLSGKPVEDTADAAGADAGDAGDAEIDSIISICQKLRARAQSC